MKKTIFVVVLALALTFAFAAGAFARQASSLRAAWTTTRGSIRLVARTPGTAWVASGTSNIGSNTVSPGAHANYLATTAKCGICHSVHRAAGDGTKLLPTANATCSGCHVGSTAVTAKIITWADVDLTWVPSYDESGNVTNEAAAGGGGGPHNDPVWDTALEAGATEYPMPSYELEPFSRYGCQTRRCHATNPHGANSSKYKIFAAKLLFNNTPAQDSEEYPELVEAGHTATYGGDDAIFDDYGATDAAVMRFVFANPTIVQANMVTGDIKIKKTGEAAFRAPDAAETHALVAGLTCGRPSNPGTGEDECHAEASYAIIDKGIKENRNHATKITGNDNSLPAWPNAANGGSNNYFRTDNTGGEADGWGGNDNRDSKTGHVAGSFVATAGAGSYAPISGCTSCHDQTDSANTVAGKFTFPHGQTPTGMTNATAVGGATGTGVRSRIWSGWSGSIIATKTVTDSTTKAYDGQCLKCHRDGAGEGIGLTK